MKALKFIKMTPLCILFAAFLLLANNTVAQEKNNSRKENSSKEMKDLKPPTPKKVSKYFDEHGSKRYDDYFWINDKTNPEVIEYINKENEYTEAFMIDTKELQEKLYNEIVARIKQDDQSVPYLKNGYYYYTRYEKGKQYPYYCRNKGSLDAQEEIILDQNELAKGFQLYKIGDVSVSPNSNLLAYSVDTVGNNKYVIYVKDLNANKNLDDVIENISGNIVWANDNKNFFYPKNDEANRSYKIFMHTLGDVNSDKEIFHEADEKFQAYVFKSASEKYIFIGSASSNTADARFLDADNVNSELKLIQPREENIEYYPEHHGENFLIRTNKNALNFKLVSTPVKNYSGENWKDFVDYDEKILLENFDVFKNFIVLSEKQNGLRQFRIVNVNEKKSHYIKFNEKDYEASSSGNYEFDTDKFRYTYMSLKTPPSTFEYDLVSKEKELLKQTEVLSGYNPEDYITDRVYATAKDGTRIPVSIVYKKGIKKDGNNPLLLMAYGSYGMSMPSFFSYDRISLLDRGIIYAIAHIRGGKELGEDWYNQGKMLNKKNSFTDFIDCSEFLIKEKYTNKNKLFANGGSAGGLLMGAVMNMRPELYKGVIAEVPWVDVISDMMDSSIPLTTLEYEEWGNPNVKEYYDYMLSYSPYDNVKKQNYPALLATGGINDAQVFYWNPVKWVAKLREMKTDKNPILLKMNMGAGHSGKSGRYERYEEIAFKYAFILKMLDMKK